MRPLLREFVAGLAETVSTLRKASSANDVKAVRTICRQLMGIGNGYGFPQVTDLSRLVLDYLDEAQTDIDAIHRSVNELVHTLRWVATD